jgi:hypothetical protein
LPNHSFERNTNSAVKFGLLMALLSVRGLHSLLALRLRPLNSVVMFLKSRRIQNEDLTNFFVSYSHS